MCVPTYNGARYLSECLDSILAQTHSDFELVVVDDRSSDGSVDIARTYAQRDSRIRVIVNDNNLGLVGNWNRTVEVSRAEWIKMVFQDDVLLPECASRMLSAATNSAMPIVSCARDFIFEANTTEDDRQFYVNHKAFISAVYHDANEWSPQRYSETALECLGANLLGEPTAVLLHRSVFERFGWFNPYLHSRCDLEYWNRVASNTGTIHIPEVLTMFRVHENAMSAYLKQTAARRYRFEILDLLLILHDYAFHPVYAGLRAVARNRRPRFKVRSEFWKRAVSARWIAKEAANDLTYPDPSLLEEWRRVAQDYPRLRAIPPRVRMLAKWAALWRSMPQRTRRPKAANR